MKGALFLTLLVLAGCGPLPIYAVAPGHPLASGIAMCTGYDTVGRCTGWTSNADTCVNPKGPAANPPTVPCPKGNDGKPVPFK